MGWNKDGSTVRAEYCGVQCTGVVESSRVKYGGSVQYTVVLDEPLVLPWSTEAKTKVLIDEDEVLVDFGILDEDAYLCRLVSEYTMDDVGCEFDPKIG